MLNEHFEGVIFEHMCRSSQLDHVTRRGSETEMAGKVHSKPEQFLFEIALANAGADARRGGVSKIYLRSYAPELASWKHEE